MLIIYMENSVSLSNYIIFFIIINNLIQFILNTNLVIYNNLLVVGCNMLQFITYLNQIKS